MHRAGKDAMLKLIEAEREGEQVRGRGAASCGVCLLQLWEKSGMQSAEVDWQST